MPVPTIIPAGSDRYRARRVETPRRLVSRWTPRVELGSQSLNSRRIRPRHPSRSRAASRRWIALWIGRTHKTTARARRRCGGGCNISTGADGCIVRKTALQITRGAHTDVDKVHRIYDWIIVSTYREPKCAGAGLAISRRCSRPAIWAGNAPISTDVCGLCRAAGIPARDAYGCARSKCVWLQGAGRQPGKSQGRATLPFRVYLQNTAGSQWTGRCR